MSADTEHQILVLSAKEWDLKGPPGIMDISEVVVALPLAPSDVLAGISDLFTHGLIDMNRLKTSAFLTPEGYDASQRQPSNSEKK